MTIEALQKAYEEGTWLIARPDGHMSRFDMPTKLVRADLIHVGEIWVIVPGEATPFSPEEFYIATPNDMLKYGDG